MAEVIGDVCAPTGKYVKDGEEKTSWAKCGVLMKTEKGYRIKLDTVPVGGDGQGIWFSVFEKEGRSQGGRGQTSSRASQAVDKEDDLPF